MIVKPRLRGFLCLSSHPDGCKKIVENQIQYTQKKGSLLKDSPKNVLIIGSSMGYGLSSRIVSIFSSYANTLGISLEKMPTETKTGTAGYYYNKALKEITESTHPDLYFNTLGGDAFSNEMKSSAIEEIKNNMGKIDLLIYSIASPKRIVGDKTYHSYLKTIGKPFKTKTLDFASNEIKEVSIETATQEEIDSTVKVMGGEDWFEWVKQLTDAHVLSENFKTISYSYVGPQYIAPIYREGTIGEAKKHLEKTVSDINEYTKSFKGQAHVTICKALITQASVAIPAVGLYTSVLYKVMKKKGTHEGCIEQINRLFHEHLLVDKSQPDIIRIDDLELEEDTQKQVMEIFNQLSTQNYHDLADSQGVKTDFMNIFGFEVDGVDYEKDQDIS